MKESFSAFVARTGETDPLRALSSFVSFGKSELLKEGQLNEQTEQQVNAGALNKAVELGLTEPPENDEDAAAKFNTLFGSKPTPDLYAVQARAYEDSGDTESAQKLRAYAALHDPRIRAEYGDSEDYQAKLESAAAEAEPLFKEAEAKRYAVRKGLARIASYEEGGRIRVETADDINTLDDKALAEYASVNSQYVSPNHLFAIREKLKPVAELDGLSQAQLERMDDIGAEITALVKTDKDVADKLERATRLFMSENRTTGMKAVEGAGALVTGVASAPIMALMDLAGKDVPAAAPMDQNAATIAEELRMNHDLGRRYSQEQLQTVVQDIITARGVDSLEYDPENPAAVARKLSNGKYVLPTKNMVNKQTFDRIVDSLPASELQKRMLREERATNLDAYAKIIMPQIMEAGNEDLIDLVLDGRRAGKSEGEIIEQVASSDKYSGVLNRVENFGISLLKTVTDLIPAIGAAMPDIVGRPITDLGYSINKKLSDEMAANAALAGLTGKDFGWVQETFQAAPQLIADVVIARGAGAATRGFGSLATKLAPKTAGNIAVFAHTGSGGLARTAVRELTERLLPAAANEAGWLTSQGARVFGATYTSTRSQLETQTNADGTPKYSMEQVDALATEAGLANSLISNAITFGFNRLGAFAGAERMMRGSGFSVRTLRQYYDDVAAGVKQLPDDLRAVVQAKGALPPFEEFAGELAKGFLRPIARDIVKGGMGEAAEEYLQTVGEDIVNAAITGEDFDMQQTTRNAAFAALIGGVLGAGGAAVSAAETQFMRDPEYRRVDFEETLLRRQIDNLRAANAPATADFLETQLRASQRNKITIRQQFAEYGAERSAIERSLIPTPPVDEAAPAPAPTPLGLPAPELSGPQQAQFNILVSRKAQLERRITDAESAVPEEERTDRQRIRLQNLRDQLANTNDQLRNIYDYTEPVTPTEGEPRIVGYVPADQRTDGVGPFITKMLYGSEISEFDQRSDEAVLTSMDDAALEFGLPATDEDIDERHAAAVRKALPKTAISVFAKEATNEQRAALKEAVDESRAMYREQADNDALINRVRTVIPAIESRIAELKAEPETAQTQRLVAQLEDQLKFHNDTVTELRDKGLGIAANIKASLEKARDVIGRKKNEHDALILSAMEMIDEAAAQIVQKKSARIQKAKQAGKTDAQAETEAAEIEAEETAEAVAEIAETVGPVALSAAGKAIRVRRSTPPSAAPAPVVTETPAPVVTETSAPVVTETPAVETPAALMTPQEAQDRADIQAQLEADQEARIARVREAAAPPQEGGPLVTEGEAELATAIAALAPTPLDKVLNTPEPVPTSTTGRAVRVKSDQIAELAAKADAAIAALPSRQKAEAENKAKRAAVMELLEGNETVEHTHKGKTVTVPLLRDVDDPNSFLTHDDYVLFHDLLNKGMLPRSVTWLNSRIAANNSYAHYDYVRPFRLTLQREIEKRWPHKPYTPPEQLYTKEDLRKAMEAAKFERGGMVTPRMQDFFNDFRAGMVEKLVDLMAELPAATTRRAAAIRKQVKDLNARLRAFDADVADVYAHGTTRRASAADRAVALTKIVGRVKQAGDVVYKGLPVTLDKDGTPSGVHTNDPYDAANLLERGISLKIPKKDRATLNPAIHINRLGYVTHVDLAEQETPVARAGDRTRPIDAPLKVQENDPDYSAFVAALPEVPARHIKLLGNPFMGEVSDLTREWDFIQPIIDYFNSGASNVEQLAAMYNVSEAELSDFQNAVVAHYLLALREYSLAVRIKEAALEGKAMPLMRRLFLDRKTKELSPSVRKMLQKRFRKAKTDEELLRQYAIQLDAELSDAFTVQGTEDFSDLESDANDISGEEAGRVSPRWQKVKEGDLPRPAPVLSVVRNLRKRFADGWARRNRMMKTELVTETGEERALSGVEQAAMEIEAALASNFLEDSAEAPELVVEAEEVEVDPTRDLRITGDPDKDAESIRVYIAHHGRLIDENPRARRAFEKLAASFGLSEATVRAATGVELLELARGEQSALRERAAATLEKMIAERAGQTGDTEAARAAVTEEFRRKQEAVLLGKLSPQDMEYRVNERTESVYNEELSYLSADARAAVEADEQLQSRIRDRARKNAELQIRNELNAAVTADRQTIFGHVDAVADFVRDVKVKQRAVEARKLARQEDRAVRGARRQPLREVRYLPNGEIQVLRPAQDTSGTEAPDIVPVGAPITLPNGDRIPRLHAVLIRRAYAEELEAMDAARPVSSAGPEYQAWSTRYSRVHRYIQNLDMLLAGKKKFFTVGKDIPAEFYSAADVKYDFADSLVRNTAELDALGLEAGNNKSIFNALRNVGGRLKPVAEMLLARPDILSRVSVEVVTMPNTHWAGKYIPSSNTIVINRAKTNGRGVADVLAHELIHAATHYAIRNPDTAGAKALISRLDSIRKVAQTKAQRAGYNQRRYTAGLESLDEFVTYTFTSPDFQRMLREIDDTRSFLRRIVDAIASLFGKRNDSVSRLLRDMAELVGRANMRPYGTALSEDIAADMDQELLFSEAEQPPTSPYTETDEPAPDDLVTIPEPEPELQRIDNPNLQRPMGIDMENPNVIHVNRELLAQETEGMSERDAAAYERKLVNHELAHIAGLNALTASDISDLAASMDNAMLWDVADEYYRNSIPDSGARYAAIAADRQNGTLTDDKLVHEFLRMKMERITSGFTSEEDLSFYRSNPNFLQRMLRYMRGYINRLRERISGPYDSQTAASLNRTLRIYSEMNGDDVVQSEDDAVRKIAEGSATFLYSAPVPDNYERRGLWKKWFVGEFPDSVKSLVDEKGFANRAAARVANKFDADLRRFRRRGIITEADVPTLRAALGGLPELSHETRALIRADYDAKLEKAREAFNKSEGSQADKDALDLARAAAYSEREQATDAAYEAADHEVRENMKRARAALPAEVVETIDRMRKAIDRESAKLASDPFLPDELRASINENLGIYLTQTYRAFTTKGWFDMLKAGGVQTVSDQVIDFDRIKNNALKQFARQAEDQIRYRHRFSRMTKSALDAKVRDEAPALTQKLFDDFIEKYDGSGAGLALLHESPAAVWKALVSGEASDVSMNVPHSDALRHSRKNLLARKNLPQFMRDMLGEVTDPLETAVRSLATVNTLAANQQFLSKLREQGLAGGWLLDINAVNKDATPEEQAAQRESNLAEIRRRGYWPVKADDDRVSHLNGLYGPKELRDSLKHMFERMSPEALDSSASAIRTISRGMRNAAGTAMGAKVLLSVGARSRDFMSDFLFFGPLQGVWFNPFKISRWKEALHSSFASMATDADMDARLDLLTRLGVLENESNTTALRQMFRAFRDGDDDSLHRIREALFDTSDPTEWRKLGRKLGRLSPLEKAAAISNTIGTQMKIAIFEKELATLNRAYPENMTPDRDGITENMREAARKTNMTSRASSNVAPIVKQFTGSGLGSLLAPFLTFKAEVMRILLNTPKLATEEIHSDNPVIRRRGYQRMGSFFFTFSAMPTLVAGVYQSLFAFGFGDDDDKTPDALAEFFKPRTNEDLRRDAALRAGLPDWQQGNTVSFAVIGDKVRMLDLTFINPMAVWTDGLLRSHEHARLGEWEKIPAALGSWFGTQIVGEQIAAGAVIDALNNKDDKGMPISTASDPFPLAMWKRMWYVMDNGYFPPAATFGKRLYTGDFGSSAAGTEEGRAANRLETLLGEVMGARPRALPVSTLFERAVRRSNSEMRDVRTATSVASSDYPLDGGSAVERAYNARERALIKRAQEVRDYSEQFERIGMDVGAQIRAAREVGMSKRAFNAARAGLAEAPKFSTDDMRAIYNARAEADGPEAAASVLRFLAGKAAETGQYIVLNP